MPNKVTTTALRALGYAARPLNPLLRLFMPPPEVVQLRWPADEVGPLTIGFVTDLHLGPTTPPGYIHAALRLLASQKPDVVLYGGDFLFRDPKGAEALSRTLAALRPPQGCHAVLGNHDHWLGTTGIKQALAQAGVELLLNNGRRIATPGGSLWIGGVDDVWTGRPDISAALAGRSPNEPTVLLSHNPDIAPAAADHGVDLVLSGHTHGGQVRILGRMPFPNSRYGATHAAGWSHVENTAVYTSRGLGTVEIALRVGARPEVTVIKAGAS